MREKKQVNIEIGEQVRLARESARLTQEQLAERIDVSPQFVSDMERGVVGISIPTLKRICTTLCVSSDQILFAAGTDPSTAMLSKCSTLTLEQLTLLSEIIDRYVAAIHTAQNEK